MKKFLTYCRGILALLIMVINLLIIPILVIIVALLQKIMPIKSVSKWLYHLSHHLMPETWVDINTFAMKLASPTPLDIHSQGELSRNGWYFLICNHQSWLDILILQRVFQRKIPMLKFFMKQELLWTLPIGGLACYLLDFPFMKRHSKDYLKKHPEQRNKDIETTRESCEKFKTQPITIMNYLEGTRFTKEKQKARKSPYKHLLPPKAGGMAFVLATLEDQIQFIIDTTIIYHTEEPTFWNFLMGRIPNITVFYNVLPVPQNLRGNYYENKEFRKVFQQWLNQRWQTKDTLIEITRPHIEVN